uniref:Ig-like domain-containing protein n=1 Tax=Bos indicus x Bos taurus TaxID=30522 RepID=A0A4W2GT36_BOBOX
MHSATHSVLLIILIFRGTNGDSVNQTEGPVTVPEGAPMTLNCTYQIMYSDPYLFWYVQHLNKAPQVLLKGSRTDQKPKSEGFQATLDRSDSSFHLQKRAVQASDSAVCYCALSDTVRKGCGGAEHKPRVQMGLWLWAALEGVLFLSPVGYARGIVKALPCLFLRAKDLGILGLPYREESGVGQSTKEPKSFSPEMPVFSPSTSPQIESLKVKLTLQ